MFSEEDLPRVSDDGVPADKAAAASEKRVWFKVAALVAGYPVGLVAAIFLVSLRYLWADPRDVAASSGMYAFGDLLGILFLFGLFATPPTWFLLHLLRGADRFWSLFSWGCVFACFTAPLHAAVLWSGGLLSGKSSPAADALLLLHFTAVLRGFVAPGAILVLAISLWACGAERRAAGRRIVIALAMEAASLAAMASWWVTALIRASNP